MKSFIVFVASVLPVLFQVNKSLSAELIAQWNFNNSVQPSWGQGMASLIGGVTASFATGCTNDPSAAGNTGWNTTQYPLQGTGNKTAGARFAVSTSGYADIVVRWDHRVSGSASKYCRLQYSGDGVIYHDAPGPVCAAEVSASPSYYESQTVDLTGLAEADDNPGFVFRIVSEFESTALSSGTEQYATTYGTNRYSTAGTIRLDMVTVSGNPVAGTNTPPTISAILEQTLRLHESTGPLSFTVTDLEDPPTALGVKASSSNPAVAPESGISLAGTGQERTVTVTTGGEAGVALVTLRVTDTGGRSSATRFAVNVLPTNTPPFISAVRGTNLLAGAELNAVIGFTVGDLESSPDGISITAESGNPTLLPGDPGHLSLYGSGSNRFVSLTPVPGLRGAALITLAASDGASWSRTSFPIAATPAAGCLFYEPFSYPDGPTVANSGLLWANRSGTVGACEITNGQLRLSTLHTEDIVAPIPGAPFQPQSGRVLYASFKAKFLAPPEYPPCYFAHFFGANSSRARIYAGPSGAWPGAFSLNIANGCPSYRPHAAVLSTNTWYTVVVKYSIASASSALWVNPASEATPAAIADDVQAPSDITSYGFLQDSELGAAVLVDDLKVGLSFAAVTKESASDSIRLGIERCPGGVVLRWSDPAFALQASPDVVGLFTNVTGAMSAVTNVTQDPARFFRVYRSP